MPKNRLIYIGVLVIAAVAIIWLANEFTKFVYPALPYVLALGILLLLGGVFWEVKKSKDIKPGEAAAEHIGETKM